MEHKFFAGFIMTYNRAHLLAQTIDQIFLQTRPPSKLLIVDNSDNDETKALIAIINNPLIQYFSVGYNAGPAGAARIGLQMLANEGYQWIYWGDDDDPPTFNDTFEVLLRGLPVETERVGIVGAVGHYFSTYTGEIKRMSDDQLFLTKDSNPAQFIAVDSIAGNQSMIVNADVVRAGVLPNKELFFGFEELDFCLRARAIDFSLSVSSDLFIRARTKYRRLQYKSPLYIKQKNERMIRQYYSTRNLLLILKENGFRVAYLYQLVKNLVKSIYGFRYGLSYGIQNANMILIGIFHSITNQFGEKKAHTL